MLSAAACSHAFVKSSEPGNPAITAADFISFDGTHLPLRRWLPKEKTHSVIIAVHGFNDYSHFIDNAANYFSQQGIAVYAYDQRGFGAAPDTGRWAGKQDMAHDLRTLINLMQRRYPDRPLFLLGESMGAAVVLHTLANYNIDIDGVLLSAPAVWGWDAMPFWQRWGLKLAAISMPSMTFTGQSLQITASDNHAMLVAFSADPLVIKATRVDTVYGLVNLMQAGYEAVDKLQLPALILYGEKDEVIPKKAILDTFGTLAAKSETQRLQLYNNGYHMLLRDLQAEIIWRDIIIWIQNQSSQLPSEQQGLSSPVPSR